MNQTRDRGEESFSERFLARQKHEILARVTLYEDRRRRQRIGMTLAAAAAIIIGVFLMNLFPGSGPETPVDLEGVELVQAFSDTQQDPLAAFGPWPAEDSALADTGEFPGDDLIPLLDELIEEAGRPTVVGL